MCSPTTPTSIPATRGVAAGTPGSANTDAATNVAGTHGSVNIAANGAYTYSLDNTNATVQALAAGETLTDIFTCATITNSQGATSSTTLTVTVNGSNDAPLISIGAGDSAAESLTETNAGLSVSGTLSIGDVDTSDTVTMSKVDTIAKSDTYTGVLPTDAAPKAMFSVTGDEPSNTLDSLANGINRNFDSGAQAFDFIPAGQALILTYTMRATDSQGATISQTFTATNPAPVAQPDTNAINEDATLTVSAANGVIQSTGIPAGLDSDGDALMVIGVSTGTAANAAAVGTYGHLALNADGSYSYVPTPPPTRSAMASPPRTPSATRSATVKAAPPSPR
jgi:VCBS repeat-containing protein